MRLPRFKTTEDRLLKSIETMRAQHGDSPQLDRHIDTLILLTIQSELATIRRGVYVLVFAVVFLGVWMVA